MTLRDRCRSVASATIVLTAVLMLGGCPQQAPPATFTAISEHGFDAADTAQDINDYPWAMVHFTPDGASTGRLFVATGNSVMNQIQGRIGFDISEQPLFRPPEIRRYRPEQGPRVWERVFDYRDVETGPDWQTSGFRAMAAYRGAAPGDLHLYAGTFGRQPALWRSPTGDPGTWELVWQDTREGSIRDLCEHDGRLYIAITREFQVPPLPGEVYVTDGQTVQLVNGDGFGNPNNVGVFALASFNGWLYAGTINVLEGYELWKLAGPGGDDAPRPIITGGGPSSANQAVTEMRVFNGQLYVPALLFLGLNISGRGALLRGADMVRVDGDDRVTTVVGPGSVGGVATGFGSDRNAYLWSLAVHDGRLYCGVWDANSIILTAEKYWYDYRRTFNRVLGAPLFTNTPGAPAIDLLSAVAVFNRVTDTGAELWVTDDGAHWRPVFTNGLGNPNNFGIRKLVSVGDTLYLGLANIIEGLQVWEMRE